MTKRGDVVIIDFPFTDLPQSKARPAVVIQNDTYNQRIRKTIVAMITGNLRRSSEPSHVLVDPRTPDGASSGLRGPSLIACTNLYTIEQSDIIATIGQLSGSHLNELDTALKLSLNLA